MPSNLGSADVVQCPACSQPSIRVNVRKMSFSLMEFFLTGGDCVPPGTLGNVWNILVVTTGVGCYWHLVSRGLNAQGSPVRHSYLVQNALGQG